MSLKTAAAHFRALHVEPALLILPNAWDPGSARLMQQLGAPAVATTSAGMAWSRGYADGGRLPAGELLATVAAIFGAVTVPLSIDIEDGYSQEPTEVAGLTAKVAAAGAVGINIEDGTASPALLSAKLTAIRAALSGQGLDLFINVRTDVYLRGLAPAGARVAEVLNRARLYQAAGADGLFVPGVTASDEIAALVQGSALPLNVMARPGLPAADELRKLGVRRLSAGSGIAEALWGDAARMATEFLRDGVSKPFLAPGLSYGEINGLFTR
jgi:2-methylisocitrate lyase-like PEP mutase family enzyme